MKRIFVVFTLLLILHGCGDVDRNNVKVDWKISDLLNDADSVELFGSPETAEDASVKGAVKFDGDDGIFLNYNPLTGLNKFTIEVIFYPNSGGKSEQRFLHFGKSDSNRVLFETRLIKNNKWYFDAFTKSGKSEAALLDSAYLHKVNQWHHAALVFNNGNMKTYVNGSLELTGEIEFVPFGKGKTSLGVRMNKKFWFEGEIARVRIVNESLSPADFLKLK